MIFLLIILKKKMSSVIISSIKNITSNDERITTKFLTKYEKTRLLGQRALQLSMNSKTTLENIKETDCLKIAEMELKEKKIPLMIQRHLPNGKIECWKIEEMEII